MKQIKITFAPAVKVLLLKDFITQGDENYNCCCRRHQATVCESAAVVMNGDSQHYERNLLFFQELCVIHNPFSQKLGMFL